MQPIDLGNISSPQSVTVEFSMQVKPNQYFIKGEKAQPQSHTEEISTIFF